MPGEAGDQRLRDQETETRADVRVGHYTYVTMQTHIYICINTCDIYMCPSIEMPYWACSHATSCMHLETYIRSRPTATYILTLTHIDIHTSVMSPPLISLSVYIYGIYACTPIQMIGLRPYISMYMCMWVRMCGLRKSICMSGDV